MKISSLMIPDPITITENASIAEAIELMKVNAIRHLPVVSKGNKLKGFVTLADLKQGLIPSMVADVSLADLMIRNPIVVNPDDDLEIAARIIYRHKIGGLPVVKNKKLVGIITETDILRAFIDMMGLLTTSSRIDLVIADEPGLFKQVLQIISDNGGDIINVGMSAQQTGKRVYYFRLSTCNTDIIKKALEKEGFEVVAATN
ncbi:MAG: CBS and ACT domain-containing protein [Pseudomonadota bacterium]|uniref:CBS domain-containing protein n=1 Tax=Candidatus Desulfatibia profunda TaxID=2841695 RepID=A0A8J6NU42_9BACT|nr:CBS domain-containing protein [Candidatus Desulfatibia profunda]MBL7180495.1 CBS domain-containing protein [Desulfobacterales bacterium]